MGKEKRWSGWKELGSLSLAIFFALTIRWGVAEAYVIPSGSMLPTLLIHDHIFVNKMIYGIRVPFSSAWLVQFKKPERGEVIVFKKPDPEGTVLVKRIIGLPGDKIDYHHNRLYVNDKWIETNSSPVSLDFDQLMEKDLENQKSSHQDLIEKLGGHSHRILHVKDQTDMEIGPMQVPPHSLFVMGDHRDNSSDSRVWGFAPTENILGKAMFVWLSCEESIPGLDVGCDPTTLRWTRFFHPVN